MSEDVPPRIPKLYQNVTYTCTKRTTVRNTDWSTFGTAQKYTMPDATQRNMKLTRSIVESILCLQNRTSRSSPAWDTVLVVFPALRVPSTTCALPPSGKNFVFSTARLCGVVSGNERTERRRTVSSSRLPMRISGEHQAPDHSFPTHRTEHMSTPRK